MDPKAVAEMEARNAARYEFLSTCNDPTQIECIAEVIGDRHALSKLIDALIAEAA